MYSKKSYKNTLYTLPGDKVFPPSYGNHPALSYDGKMVAKENLKRLHNHRITNIEFADPLLEAYLYNIQWLTRKKKLLDLQVKTLTITHGQDHHKVDTVRQRLDDIQWLLDELSGEFKAYAKTYDALIVVYEVLEPYTPPAYNLAYALGPLAPGQYHFSVEVSDDGDTATSSIAHDHPAREEEDVVYNGDIINLLEALTHHRFGQYIAWRGVLLDYKESMGVYSTITILDDNEYHNSEYRGRNINDMIEPLPDGITAVDDYDYYDDDLDEY